ncbi:MAG TPA: malto-oligosyltrehalose synthase [Candidatus Saccharimonadales bacterium]|nr:malto-oligosyltrehalose synthase [Candidatus Saccharimonadales bacterium]
MTECPFPVATYRLQFNADFRLSDATSLVEYLAKLGITDIYASPILTSRKGSRHGYDVTDPTQIDPDIGTVNDFEQLQNELMKHEMRLILDIVPNHMAASSENRWWMDVLENGSESVFASYFDIDWHPPTRNLEGKVLLPVLGRPFGEILDNGELRLTLDNGKFFVQYFDSIFPLMPRSYRRLLKHRIDELKNVLSEDSPDFQEYSGIIAALSSLSESTRSKSEAENRVRLDGVRERLQRLLTDNSEIAAFVNENIIVFNGRSGDPASLCALEHLLGEQHFRLAYWQDRNQAINYRRFFAISDLVGMRVEDPLVFDATHDQIFHLCAKGAIRGLRVDHIDGLRDPVGYLNRLQERLVASQPPESGPPYVLVEKILLNNESLSEDWAVSGTTGYEFLNAANGLFVCPSGACRLEKIYFDFISKEMNFTDVIYEKKKLVMNTLLRVEMRSLGRQLADLAAHDRYARDILRPELMDALIEVTACISVYRTYIRNLDAPDSAKLMIERAIEEAGRRRPRLSRKCFAFLGDVLTLSNPPHILPDQREERLAFVMRWQQFTGPIVAKGIEDTALYVYYPLLSLNEVGGNPEPSKILGWEKFVEFIRGRQRLWPDSLNATSTHDSKLSEDVRARLNVLSEIPDEWAKEISEWSKENELHKQVVGRRKVPDANEEYLIYQAVIGILPADRSELNSISERLQAYAIKAIREAMVHTRWTEPNTAHELSVSRFIQKVISPQENSAFLSRIAPFLQKVDHAGMINGLSQALLKITCPGVSDFYQGSEFWNRNLVDPDNRGRVDFQIRTDDLQALVDCAHGETMEIANNLLTQWHDGRVKLYMIWKALGYRRQHPVLFREGEFIPLEVVGDQFHHIIAFLRRHGKEQALIVIPRWVANMPNSVDTILAGRFWRGTNLRLPPTTSNSWRNVFTAKACDIKIEGNNSFIAVGDLLADFPVALLVPSETSTAGM